MNPRPPACKAGALPTELRPHIATYLCTDGVANHPRILISRSFLNKRPTKYGHSLFGGKHNHMVGNKGLEPLRLSALEPKSSASANSANSPWRGVPAYIYEKRYTKTSVSLLVYTSELANYKARVLWKFVLTSSGILILSDTPTLTMAAPVGLEPTTSRLTVWRSTD